ncbi:MAG: exopolyphosphatase [Lachnospiraceae bacterium]|nr:exopolyphosphatase [Lachnospiraceae bacterium]
MAIQTFAAIHVGSYNLTMKIYEIMPRKGFKLIDTVTSHVELGADTYTTGRLSNQSVDVICDMLLKFKKKMKEYQTVVYSAYATSAVREAVNCEFVLDRIMTRTGIEVKTASNSEHRFMMYEGIAATLVDFPKIIQKNTVIIDVAAGSIQVSLFDKNKLSVTQNITIGSLRIREMLGNMGASKMHMKELIEEYVENELDSFENMYLKEKEIKNIIGVGEEIHALAKLAPEMNITATINAKQLEYICDKLEKEDAEVLGQRYGISYEWVTLLVPSAIIYQNLLARAKAEVIYISDSTFCDGIVTEYMESEKKLTLGHDFQSDIISSAEFIAKRYRCEKKHNEIVVNTALSIFDNIKKLHGLNQKAKLQLQLAAILHECGKYVNINNVADNSYHIVMSTEILGISHKERRELAYICRYVAEDFPAYEELMDHLNIDQYSKIAKLTAIIRLANAMDRSHRQKIQRFNVVIKDKRMEIVADTVHDISLELGLFDDAADFFEDVYGIRAVLRQKRSV